MDGSGVNLRTTKPALKGRERLWHNLLIWVEFTTISFFCQSFITLVLFLLKDWSRPDIIWHHPNKPILCSHKLSCTHLPFTSLCTHVRRVWILLCQHCTHTMAENIRQLLIYMIITGQYLLWQVAKVPDAGWAVGFEPMDDIWSSPRPNR